MKIENVENKKATQINLCTYEYFVRKKCICTIVQLICSKRNKKNHLII